MPKAKVFTLFNGVMLNKHLKHLILGKCTLPQECIQNILETITSPDCILETLKFKLCPIDEKVLSQFAIPMLQNTKTLKCFYVNKLKFKEQKSLVELMLAAKNHPTLEEFNLQ